ncbi:MAG: Clp1/GlmU family protein [Sulfolobaceae archaeon]|nr:Clp1/GlmU family protein [Sulfolobaceae archaeon]
MQYTFLKDQDIIIKTPCKVEVKRGAIDIQGIEIKESEEISINVSNTFTITTLSDSTIETDCQILNVYETLGWVNIANNIASTRGKVIVLGETDSGKTYFSNMLLNKLVNNSRLIDADVGQSSLFIPTFVSSIASTKQTLYLRERGFDNLEFYGDITPSSNPRLHINLVLTLIEKSSEPLKIIDTDGWVRGFLAYRHKLELIESINPDYIILFNENLKNNLPERLRQKIIFLKAPHVNKRTTEERRKRRSELYRQYFKDAKEIAIDYEELLGTRISEKLSIAWGEPIYLDTEENCSGFYINELQGALLGVIKKGKVVGASLIKSLGYFITLLTPITDFDGLILGKIALNFDYTERKIHMGLCL